MFVSYDKGTRRVDRLCFLFYLNFVKTGVVMVKLGKKHNRFVVSTESGETGVLDTKLTKSTSQVVLGTLGGGIIGFLLADFLNADVVRKIRDGGKLNTEEERVLAEALTRAEVKVKNGESLIAALRKELELVEHEDGVHQSDVDEVLSELEASKSKLAACGAELSMLKTNLEKERARSAELDVLRGQKLDLEKEIEKLSSRIAELGECDNISQKDIDELNSHWKKAVADGLRDFKGSKSIGSSADASTVISSLVRKVNELEATNERIPPLMKEIKDLKEKIKSIKVEDGINASHIKAKDDEWRSGLQRVVKNATSKTIGGGKDELLAEVESLLGRAGGLSVPSFDEFKPVVPTAGGQKIFADSIALAKGKCTIYVSADGFIQFGAKKVRKREENGSHFPSLLASILIEKAGAPSTCTVVDSSNDWLTFVGTVAYDGDLNGDALKNALTWLGGAAKEAKNKGGDATSKFIELFCRADHLADTYGRWRGSNYRKAAAVALALNDFDYNNVGLGSKPMSFPIKDETVIAVSALVLSCFRNGREYEVVFN